VTNERAVASSREKTRIYESAEYRITGGLVEPPQSLRLLRRQPQARHFEEFSSNASNYLLDPPAVPHRSSRVRSVCDVTHNHTRCHLSDRGNRPELVNKNVRGASNRRLSLQQVQRF
jgi:hypothetical protein